ncbi:hypothetical protein SAMN06265365_1663 [Tistlia consotensis]|uniref:DUF1109 domain-containing protein n=1 Tax=Tistlia consotensis USBA 355 TaxID=560819 RepID=A0A1Y6CQW3_9PROT|nr:NrsF family protein [Tistlia consotensis]SMF84026.1 hypothetical protein SAMN05428998_15221 [Tistlia consotensis USBA 355]SNS40028.1 hypothetical protein SAMN06265365_1663 [Tistlia consotensis]
MSATDDVIRKIAGQASPVRPLPSPWLRAMLWLVVALCYAGVMVLMMSPRPDLTEVLARPEFQIEQLAALATAFTAAVAALSGTIPGRGRWMLLLPLAPLALWLGSVAWSSAPDWTGSGLQDVMLRPDWMCFPAIVAVGALPACLLVSMLRRGAPLTPCTTVGLGVLAAAAIGDVGLRFFHVQDVRLMILAWQLGSVAVLVALASCMGRYLFKWRHQRIQEAAE